MMKSSPLMVKLLKRMDNKYDRMKLIDRLERMADFPEDYRNNASRFDDYMGGETHREKDSKHELKHYRANYWTSEDGRYELDLHYNVCETCKKTRNKFAVLFDNWDSKSFEKWFIKHGKEQYGNTLLLGDAFEEVTDS